MGGCKFVLADGLRCGSHAFNIYQEGIEQGDLCDRHYFQALLIQSETPCVWTKTDSGYFRSGCDDGEILANATANFCENCGHPVQVNQPQDAAEEG